MNRVVDYYGVKAGDVAIVFNNIESILLLLMPF